MNQIDVIRKRVADSELGEGHEHQDFETCEDCEAAISARSYLQTTGWQNSIILLERIDHLERALQDISDPDQRRLNTSAYALQQIAKQACDICNGTGSITVREGDRAIAEAPCPVRHEEIVEQIAAKSTPAESDTLTAG